MFSYENILVKNLLFNKNTHKFNVFSNINKKKVRFNNIFMENIFNKLK